MWGQLHPGRGPAGLDRFTPTRVGTTPHNQRASRRPRFTPTRVGTTPSPVHHHHLFEVHPHACGDNDIRRVGHTQAEGSPPRVWGQRTMGPTPIMVGRFTPTRVGTTPAAAVLSRQLPVHPHACGDNSNSYNSGTKSKGSPPRVWGQRVCPQPLQNVSRFTPTRVGTTQPAGCVAMPQPVHPHACGDNLTLVISPPWFQGSPPRVWGQPGTGIVTVTADRFTPTRVGTTRDHEAALPVYEVHPHACGDNVRSCMTVCASAGSPPRVWGQLAKCLVGYSPLRFTPTRVGTTGHHLVVMNEYEVHPHACGDNLAYRQRMPIAKGSPPRVWGQPTIDGTWSEASRFTPTRVGTTVVSAGRVNSM